KYGQDTLTLAITDSYYNMEEMIRPHMFLIETAKAAVSAEGLVPVEVPIRGGTDGARLSYMGLPCPNLGTGGMNYHGPFECITAERMDKATRVILNIIYGIMERL
ncbi:MAG: peptidase T, partial [Lachnospiraceae bacterium]|nr:peptidase T [Lachnospiraceae bacterium]